jgi:hypothetical protein
MTAPADTTAMPADRPGPLRLRAADADDLVVLSAHLQDAIVPVHDIGWRRGERVFAMVVNRFRWESPAGAVDGRPVWQRTLCGVTVAGVTRLQCRALDLRRRSRILSLLSLVSSDDGAILLVFADRATLRLSTERIDVRLEDFGEPWPTLMRPSHTLSEGDEGSAWNR